MPDQEPGRTPSHRLTDDRSHLTNETFKGLIAVSKEGLERSIREELGINPKNPIELSATLMRVMREISAHDLPRARSLESAAERLVREDLVMPKEGVVVEAHLASFGEVPRIAGDAAEPEEPEDVSAIAGEISKRRLINALIQGGARKGQYLYHLAEPTETAPGIREKYRAFWLINDYEYFLFQDLLEGAVLERADIPPQDPVIQGLEGLLGGRGLMKEIMALGDQIGLRAGKVSVDYSGEFAKIVAYGISFPVLCHELYKGGLELIAAHGLPEDPIIREKVLEHADGIGEEGRSLQLGISLWEKLNKLISAEGVGLRPYVFEQIVRLPHERFHAFIDKLVTDHPDAKETVDALLRAS
ncbi:MAG: hypothetical protein KDD64_03230 [Bdellovibrionales bacterium]|nr:hypothetical protein [Bdellovibrionales bacterium]